MEHKIREIERDNKQLRKRIQSYRTRLMNAMDIIVKMGGHPSDTAEELGLCYTDSEEDWREQAVSTQKKDDGSPETYQGTRR